MNGSPHDPSQPTQPADSGGGEATIWDTIDRARRWLDDTNGTGRAELTMRILKIAEEYGEVSTAWAGVSGQNPPLTELDHVFPQLSDYTASRSLTWSCTSMARNSETLHRCR